MNEPTKKRKPSPQMQLENTRNKLQSALNMNDILERKVGVLEQLETCMKNDNGVLCHQLKEANEENTKLNNIVIEIENNEQLEKALEDQRNLAGFMMAQAARGFASGVSQK